jgi:ankyrin repeat protein
MAVVAPSSGVAALETERIDAGGDAALIHMLPEEILLIVFAWVGTETLLCSVHAVCRSWRMALSGMYVSRPHLSHPLQPLHCAQSCTHTPAPSSSRLTTNTPTRRPNPHTPSSPHAAIITLASRCGVELDLTFARTGTVFSNAVVASRGDARALAVIGKRFRSVVTLCMPGYAPNVTPLWVALWGDRLAQTITVSLPDLTAVDFRGCKWVTDAWVAALARQLPRLVRVDFSGCTRLTDATLAILGEGCRRLVSLNLKRVQSITAAGVIAFVEKRGVAVQLRVSLSHANMLVVARQCPEFAQRHLHGLSAAAYTGDVKMVQALLRANAEVNALDSSRVGTPLHLTPLHLASQAGHLEVVRVLLDANAAVNQANTTNGLTPLYIASRDGHLEVVRVLLDANAAVNQRETDNGATPLCIASGAGHLEVVLLLLGANAAVNQALTADGMTPLFIASNAGHLGVVKALLDANAAVNQSTTDKLYTPLYIASHGGHIEVVRVLLDANASVNQRTTNKVTTPLCIASQQGHLDVVRVLLDANAAVNQAVVADDVFPLMAASTAGHEEVVRTLLESNADVGCRLTNGTSSVSSAAWRGHLGVVKLLIGAGADVNSRLLPTNPSSVPPESAGLTPLDFALTSGHDAVVEFLLQAGAST